VAVRYNKRAEEASRKSRDAKYLKKVFQDLVNCKKPTGDPDRPLNVTRAKQIERDIEAEVGMTTLNDARRNSDSASDEESEDDEEDTRAGGDSESEPEAAAKPAKPTRKTVERFRTPREEIKAQISQRDKVMGQISSALARDPAKDLGAVFEASGLMQVLQNQVQLAEARCNQLQADNKRLQEKYDEKVAENQDLKLDLKLLQARLSGGGPGQSSDPFPWSSPMAKRDYSGNREDRDGNVGGEGVVL
jgi:hypothetical protein